MFDFAEFDTRNCVVNNHTTTYKYETETAAFCIYVVLVRYFFFCLSLHILFTHSFVFYNSSCKKKNLEFIRQKS